jgi:hypothetical protein
MADRLTPGHFKITDTDEPVEPGYTAWKRAKILKALEDAQDRSKMIPAETVWKKLGLED